MNQNKRGIIFIFIITLLFLVGCKYKEKPEQELKKSQNAVQKVVGETTDVIKGAVEGINEAVY